MDNSLLRIFANSSRELIHSKLPFQNDKFQVCWYPSCGYDYRHIKHFTSLGEKNILYIHTDIQSLYSAAHDKDLPNQIFETEEFWCHHNSCRIKALDYKELNLEENTWKPNYNIIYDFGSMKNKDTSPYLFTIKINTQGFEVPIIFLPFENTNFFFDYLLVNNIKIDKVIHVNDGGFSLGLSKKKMDYIYLFLNELQTTEMLIDYSLDTKIHHANKMLNEFWLDMFLHRSNSLQIGTEELESRLDNLEQNWEEKEIFFNTRKLFRYRRMSSEADSRH